jgi:hypothetical protein
VLTMAPPTGCDSRAHGVAVTAGGPEFGPRYDGRLLTDDRGLAASRLPEGRYGRSVAATLAAPVHRRSSASGVVLNATAGWWWADPLSALVILVYGLREAHHAWTEVP